MAIELEGLEFQIEAKSEGAAKGIDALTSSLGKLKQATKGGVGLSSSVKQLQKLDEALGKIKNLDKLNSLGSALSSLDKISNIKISGTIPKRIDAIVQSANSISPETIANLNMLTEALSNLGQVGNVRIPNLQQVNQGAQTVPQVNPTVTPQDSGVEQVDAGIQQVTQSTSRLKSILSGLGGAFSKAFSVGTGALKKLASGTAKVTKGFIKMSAAIPKMAMSRLIGKVKQTTSSLGQLFGSLKRIALYRAIRAAISAITKGFSEGISNLYQYSMIMDGQFSKSMDRLATSSQYLKNSLGAMAAPILNALAPAIDFVIDKIVTLLNLINQLFARLSGAATFTAAKKVGKAWGDAAKSAGGAAKKAADEIKRYTLGFDELNILGKNKDDDSGGGGGGGADTDYGSMFEELPIDSSIGDFAERLKEAFENADWESLGRLLGGKVNEIFDSIPWGEIGTKVGKGIDGFVKTLYYFLDEIDFRNIGSHIADLLNNALENIDFSFVGRLLVKPFTSLADLIIGFVTKLDWGLVAKSLSDCVKGIFDELSDWLDSVDWVDFGQTLWQKIKDAVTNIDYAGIAKSLFTFLGKAIRSSVQFLFGFLSGIWDDITTWWNEDIKGKDFKETWNNFWAAMGRGLTSIGEFVMDNIVIPFSEALFDTDWETIKEVGSNIMAGIGEGIVGFFKDIGSWLKEHIVDPIVNGVKDLFGIHSPSTVMEEVGGNVAAGLLNGIAAPFKKIGQWIKKNILTPIKNAFKKAGLVLEAAVELVKQGWTTLKEWVGEIGAKAFSLAKKGWTTIRNFVGEIGDKAFALARSGWTTIRDWVGDIGAKAFALAKDGWTTIRDFVGEIGAKAFALAKQGWTTIREWVGEIGSKAVSLVKSGWTTLSNWVGEIGSKAVSLIKSGWTTLSSWVGEIGSKAVSLVKSGWTTLSSWVGEIGSKAVSLVKSGWTTLSSWVGTAVTASVSLVKSGWSTISSFVGTAVTTYISLAKSGWSTISSFVGTAVTTYISLAKSGWSSISGYVGSAVSVGISLWKNGWSSISSFIGTSVSVGISLFKSGWSSIKSFFGLSSGGYNTGHGFSLFQSGGSISRSGAKEFWNSMPKYAGGTVNAHGSMFMAGERGAELVGHINGRTEVLNKSQLGQVMHRSIVDGMLQFAPYITTINNKLAAVSNAIVSANLVSAEMISKGINSANQQYNREQITDWMNTVGYRAGAALYGEGNSDQIAEGVRQGVYEATARQNDLLREQNELLREIAMKDTTVEVTTNSFTKAINRKNQRDGKTVIPVST